MPPFLTGCRACRACNVASCSSNRASHSAWARPVTSGLASSSRPASEVTFEPWNSNLKAAVENDPQVARFRFTRHRFHVRSLQTPIPR